MLKNQENDISVQAKRIIDIFLSYPYKKKKKKEDKKMKNKKYYFPVTYFAEGVSTGYIKLTREEANIVAFATNPKNWNEPEIEKYSGSFMIEMDQAIPEEWFEYHLHHNRKYA